VAASLGRSFLRHRSRAISAVLAGALGVTLTTTILVLTGAVTSAIQGAALEVPGAQWAASARSSSGMSERLAARASAIPGVHLAPVVRVSTRDAVAHDPLLILGVTDALAEFGPSTSALSALAVTGTHDGGAPFPVIATESWVRSHHARVGDELVFEAPGGEKAGSIVGVVDRALVGEKNVILAALPDVAAAFGRDGVVDAVLVRSDRADQADVRRELEVAFDGAAYVSRPGDSALSYERSFKSVRTILALFAFMSALVAATVVFFCWRVTLDDARPSVARLRLVGARPLVLAAGAAMVLLPITALSAMIGAPIGLLLGAHLGGFTNNLVKLTQLAVEPHTPLRVPALGGALAALIVFALALASSVRTFTKTAAIDAVLSGRPR